ncbi:MAG: hypothetical protein KI790_15005 [Cyclobacteriaceae bacterium]|nr:hypothetical protein [Cyclobacteriaceae bacterium HetDA_MAG_MS6]
MNLPEKDDYVTKLDRLEAELDDAKEALFLAQGDLKRSKSENQALTDFLQNLYLSCKEMEDSELDLKQVVTNLKKNIEVFAEEFKIPL